MSRMNPRPRRGVSPALQELDHFELPEDLRLRHDVTNTLARTFKGVDAIIAEELELNVAKAMVWTINPEKVSVGALSLLIRDMATYTHARFVGRQLLVRAPLFDYPSLKIAQDCEVWDQTYTDALSTPSGVATEIARTLTNTQAKLHPAVAELYEPFIQTSLGVSFDLQQPLTVIDHSQSRYRPGERQE